MGFVCVFFSLQERRRKGGTFSLSQIRLQVAVYLVYTQTQTHQPDLQKDLELQIACSSYAQNENVSLVSFCQQGVMFGYNDNDCQKTWATCQLNSVRLHLIVLGRGRGRVFIWISYSSFSEHSIGHEWIQILSSHHLPCQQD